MKRQVESRRLLSEADLVYLQQVELDLGNRNLACQVHAVERENFRGLMFWIKMWIYPAICSLHP